MIPEAIAIYLYLLRAAGARCCPKKVEIVAMHLLVG